MQRLALEHGAYAAELNTAFEQGGKGATALAEAVVAAADEPNDFRFAYADDAPIEEKIRAIATQRLRRGRRLPAQDREGEGGALRARGAREAADLHGEDPPLPLPRRDAPERADRLHRDRAGPPPVHRRGLDRRALRRHADDAGPRQGARRVRDRHRRPTATPSVCSSGGAQRRVRHRHRTGATFGAWSSTSTSCSACSTTGSRSPTARAPARSASSATRCGSTWPTASRS